jgi:nitric oxide reductase NorQ protein
MSTNGNSQQYQIEEFVIKQEPYYVASYDEVEIFEAAYRQRVPVLLKGPTGTGKTRFVEYMAWKLGQPLTMVKDSLKVAEQAPNGAVPLITVACHEDLSASDLIGRYLLDANGTHWIDGPLTRAVKAGGICYAISTKWWRRAKIRP